MQMFSGALYAAYYYYSYFTITTRESVSTLPFETLESYENANGYFHRHRLTVHIVSRYVDIGDDDDDDGDGR